MCCGEEPQSCLLKKKKAKTPEKEKAVASSSKRKTTSEGASASKRQSILAAWGAETGESSQEDFLEVESSQEYKDGKPPPQKIAASFFDQQQCSMVVVDKKGGHHVCTTSAGEHGFLEFTFQGLEHTTEIPNLALESVQACAVLPKPKQLAKGQLPGQRLVARAKHLAASQNIFLLKLHQITNLKKLFLPLFRMFPRLKNWSITRFPKPANMLHWG